VRHVRWAPWAGLAATVRAGQPETVGRGEHVAARAAVGRGADRDGLPVGRQLEHDVVALAGGVPVQPPGGDVDPGQAGHAGIPDRPLAQLGARLDHHFPRWRLGGLPRRFLRPRRARVVGLVAHGFVPWVAVTYLPIPRVRPRTRYRWNMR